MNSNLLLPNGLKVWGGARASKTALWKLRAEDPFSIIDWPREERWIAARWEECQCVNVIWEEEFESVGSV